MLETLEEEEVGEEEHHKQVMETQEVEEEEVGGVLETHEDEDGEQGRVLDGSLASGWAQVTSSVLGAESSEG